MIWLNWYSLTIFFFCVPGMLGNVRRVITVAKYIHIYIDKQISDRNSNDDEEVSM